MLCWLKLDFLGGAEIREVQWRRKPHISKDLPLPSQATRKDVQLDEVDHCTKRRKACISHLVRKRSQKLNQNWEEFLRPLCSTLCLEPEGLWRSFWRPAEYFHQFYFWFSMSIICWTFSPNACSTSINWSKQSNWRVKWVKCLMSTKPARKQVLQ